jgi:hypothetical protein
MIDLLDLKMTTIVEQITVRQISQNTLFVVIKSTNDTEPRIYPIYLNQKKRSKVTYE